MKVVTTLQHPAHVHFYRNALKQLEATGHDVWVFYRDEELVGELLDRYSIDGERLAPCSGGGLDTVRTQLRYELALLRRALRIRPDVMTAVGGVAVAHVATLVGARSVVFCDSGDHAPLNRLGFVFADEICTPTALGGDLGDKQHRYEGYHELAYLHPDRFEPDRSALSDLGVDVDERYFVLRFVAWKAHHDVGHSGLDASEKQRLAKELSELGDMYITAEEELSPELEGYRLPVPPEMIHQLLYFADLYVGDSQTMATEAAVLGTPAVRCNSFAGGDDMGNFVELEERYGLLLSTPDPDRAIDRALAWARSSTTEAEWRSRRQRLLADKIDVTEYVVNKLLTAGESDRGGTGSAVKDPDNGICD